MKTTARVKKIGTSLFVLIPAPLRNELGIEENSLVELNIKLLETDKIKPWLCTICGHEFDNIEEDLYCTSCQNEDTDKILERPEKCNSLTKDVDEVNTNGI